MGDGQFEAEVSAATGNLASRLTLSDLTGTVIVQSDSGQIDRVAGARHVSALGSQMSGAGNFPADHVVRPDGQPVRPLPGGAGTATVATGDLSGDGYQDIVIGNRVDDTVTVYMNLGDGNFELPQTYAIGPPSLEDHHRRRHRQRSARHPFGNKGGNTVSLLLNNGDGTFQPQIVLPTGTRPGAVTVADLNGDGIPDLVVDNYAADTVWVYLGEGDGKFAPR